MTHLDLFSGIGGFALAAEAVWPDAEHIFCEIDPFCRTILKKHWPHAPIYEDIRTLTNANGAGLQTTWAKQQTAGLARVDLLTGGFPCQPFSHAGRRKGTNDDRHLWPEMRRVIQEFAPRYVVAENVRGLLSIDGGMVFEQVCLDLEALEYEVQTFVIPACAVNAPHRRDRVWIVAHAKHESARDEERGRVDQGASARATRSDSWDRDWREVALTTCADGVDDGLSSGIPRPRGWRNAALKAYGNAIVPQVAEQILRTIKYL